MPALSGNGEETAGHCLPFKPALTYILAVTGTATTHFQFHLVQINNYILLLERGSFQSYNVKVLMRDYGKTRLFKI